MKFEEILGYVLGFGSIAVWFLVILAAIFGHG